MIFSIRYRGIDPITSSEDTVSTWSSIGPGFWYITKTGVVTNQPFTWGYLINFTHFASEVHQIWLTQKMGDCYHRGGNSEGWGGSWTPFSPGTATAAQVLKGYTFSSAAGSNLTGTYDPGDNYNNGYNAGRTQGRNDVTGNPNGYGLYTKSQYDANWSNGYTNGYNAGKSAFSYTQISGASGGAQEYNSDTITVPSGKSIMWLVVSISNPNLQGYTAAYLNGSKQTWTLNMNKSNAHLFVLKANVSGGQSLYIHGKRAASGTGSDMQGIALFA